MILIRVSQALSSAAGLVLVLLLRGSGIAPWHRVLREWVWFSLQPCVTQCRLRMRSVLALTTVMQAKVAGRFKKLFGCPHKVSALDFSVISSLRPAVVQHCAYKVYADLAGHASEHTGFGLPLPPKVVETHVPAASQCTSRALAELQPPAWRPVSSCKVEVCWCRRPAVKASEPQPKPSFTMQKV